MVGREGSVDVIGQYPVARIGKEDNGQDQGDKCANLGQRPYLRWSLSE